MKRSIRSYNAGQSLASSIIEIVHLMYQNKTALNFYNGLLMMLFAEKERRYAEQHKIPTRTIDKIWPWSGTHKK